MSKFMVNGNVYFSKDLDMNYLCMLKENNVVMDDIMDFTTLRCFLSYCSGMTLEQAGTEISKHVENNGGMDALKELYTVYGECVEESGFFRALLGIKEKEKPEEGQDSQEAPKATRKKSKVATE